MTGDPAISVVIPVWNEDGRTLQELRRRIVATLEPLGQPWEVVVVSDGSDGTTKQVLEGLASDDPRVRLVCLGRRRGQETALVVGLLAAKGELICTMDCDLENRPEDLPRIVAPLLQGYDLVLGYRRHRPGCPLTRRLLSRFFNSVMNLRWAVGIHDWGCGFNAGRREMFEVLRDRLSRWTDEPLKVGFIHQATRWTQVEVTPDIRRDGDSGYSWLMLCGRGITALIRGSTVVPGQRRRIRPPRAREEAEKRSSVVVATEGTP